MTHRGDWDEAGIVSPDLSIAEHTRSRDATPHVGFSRSLRQPKQITCFHLRDHVTVIGVFTAAVKRLQR